ncbi:30S ribosomal protein S4e [Candidatus Bathyarchaeota archaeon]|nr:30S ribosomal protein S4e [Candidatus Bathyarchaeota archaeon]
MGKKGPSRHMKRQVSPKFWPIHRKANVWSVKPNPGPHPSKLSTPLTIVLRDFLGITKTAKEASRIINNGKVKVDGKIRKDSRYSIGLMDVLEFPEADQRYRVLPKHGGKFILHPISKAETGYKLCRIVGKTNVRGGKTQINLHDGRSILVQERSYSVGDIVKLDVTEQEIIDHISFKPGVRVIVTGGRSQGQFGILLDLGKEPGKKRTANIRTLENNNIRTLASYVFAVGTETPLISLPGVEL